MQILGISLVNEPAPISTRGHTRIPPRTPLEQELAAIWQSLLQIEEIGIDDHFIELGGDSLRATQFLSRVRSQLGIALSFVDVYEEPTIRAISRVIRETQKEGPALPPIGRVPAALPAPLSFSQERMWFIQELAPTSTAYHVQTTVRLRGALNVPALNAVFNEWLCRHESLRTTFPAVDGKPVQVVAPYTPFRLVPVDLRALPADARFARAMERVRQEAQRPFDLGQGPLVRIELVRLDEDEHLLLVAMHHIISDAWSLGIMMRELVEVYTAHERGRTPRLPELPVQFSDFAIWQRTWLEGETLERELAYWRRQLAQVTPLELPTDRPRPAVQTYNGAFLASEIDPELHARLRETGRASNATLAMTFLAAFFVVLHRYTTQNDLVVGMPIANRHYEAIEGLVGAFVNTLALRAHCEDNPTFREFLERVRNVALEAYAHQDMPFAKLVAELNPPRELRQAPLVQVMFNHLNVPMPSTRLGDLELEVVEWDRGAAQFDLTLTVLDFPQIRRFTLEYNSDLFEHATMARFLEHYQNVLRVVAADPDVRLDQLPLLTETERHRMLVEWNDTARPLPDLPLHRLFEAQVARTPKAVALRQDERTLTFAELNARANQLAHWLEMQNVGCEIPVAVCLERSPELLIAQLAILKAGGCYVPLDPAYPAERLAFILEDTHTPLVLTVQAHGARLKTNARIVRLDTAGDAFARMSDRDLETEVTLDDPAHIIYTSGSTGNPKGVVGLHRGAVNVLAWMTREFPARPHEVACFKTAPGFVDAMWEAYAPLVSGIPLVICDAATVRDPNAFVQALSRYEVTRVAMVPTLLRVLLETQANLSARLPRLDNWIVGGEALTPDLVQLFHQQLPGRRLLNFYGATEATGNSTWFEACGNAAGSAVPIGRPIDNTRLYILDAYQNPVPTGVIGELYIGGAGLARGYFQQPALTAEKFVEWHGEGDAGRGKPNGADGTRGVLYRTGDLARYRADGNVEYHGRADAQIKVRGMRVELGEVENALKTLPQVREGVVVAVPDEISGARLIAYVTPNGLDVYDLRRALEAKLPAHMLPSAFLALDAMPLNVNGKLDRRALAARPVVMTGGQRVAVPPRDELERTLVKIWEGALQTSPIGIADDFFELGGHSLLAVRVFAEIQQTLGDVVPLTALFRSPTIEGLARELRAVNIRVPWSPLVPIQAHGTRRPLFCIHGLGGGVMGYVPLARYLGDNQPFYGLQAMGVEPGQTPDDTIEAMAARYIEAVRAVQPHGPYQIGGYSYGGTVGLEMAQQLRAQGEEVALLVMFDQPAPTPAYWHVTLDRRFITGFVHNLPEWSKEYMRLGWRDQLGRIERQARAILNKARGRNPVESREIDLRHFVDNIADVPPERVELMRAEFAAFGHYAPKFYDGAVTVLSAPRHPLFSSYDPALGWHSLARAVKVVAVPGTHRNLLQEPHVRMLAARLDALLAR